MTYVCCDVGAVNKQIIQRHELAQKAYTRGAMRPRPMTFCGFKGRALELSNIAPARMSRAILRRNGSRGAVVQGGPVNEGAI